MKHWLQGTGKRLGWILPLVGLIVVLSAVAVPGTARAAGTITLDEPPGDMSPPAGRWRSAVPIPDCTMSGCT